MSQGGATWDPHSNERGQSVLAQPSAGGATRLCPGSRNRCIFLSTASADIGAVKQHLGNEQHLFTFRGWGVLPKYEFTVQFQDCTVNSFTEII
jgi:hypothetical protein